tara:strand:- start:32611 stop:32943 length:333 start_codon:yes stop_codon:yes gene_type:complete
MKNSLKLDIARHMRQVYKLKLTQAQLDDIHDFYHELRSETLKDIVYFRFINMMLSLIFLILFFIFKNDPFDSWFTIIVLTVFLFYNKIHGIITWVSYKRLKRSKNQLNED